MRFTDEAEYARRPIAIDETIPVEEIEPDEEHERLVNELRAARAEPAAVSAAPAPDPAPVPPVAMPVSRPAYSAWSRSNRRSMAVPGAALVLCSAIAGCILLYNYGAAVGAKSSSAQAAAAPMPPPAPITTGSTLPITNSEPVQDRPSPKPVIAPIGTVPPTAITPWWDQDSSRSSDDSKSEEDRELESRARSLKRELGARNWRAVTLLHRADGEMRRSEYVGARSDYEQARRVFAETDNMPGVVMAIHGMGRASLQLGDTDTALKQLDDAIALCWEADDRRQGARVLESLAAAALLQRQTERAARLMGAADALRLSVRSHVTDDERTAVAALTGRVRQTMGDQLFTPAYAYGRNLDWQHAVEYARETTRRDSAAQTGQSPDANPGDPHE